MALALALSVFCKRPVDDVEEEFDQDDTYVWQDGEGRRVQKLRQCF